MIKPKLLRVTLAVMCTMGVMAASALALPDVSITLCTSSCAYPLTLHYSSNTVQTKLEDVAGAVLDGEGLHVLSSVGQLTALGTFRAIYLKVGKGTEKCFNQGEEANGEVASEGEAHIVYTSLAGSAQGLQLGALLLPKELTGATELSCPTSAVKVKIRGSAIASLDQGGATNTAQLIGAKGVMSGTRGKQEFRAYWNDAGTGLLARLEADFNGTGFKEVDQVIEGEPEETALAGEMFVISGR